MKSNRGSLRAPGAKCSSPPAASARGTGGDKKGRPAPATRVAGGGLPAASPGLRYLPVAFFSALLLWYSTFLPERASRMGSAVLTIPLLSLKTATCSFPASSV